MKLQHWKDVTDLLWHRLLRTGAHLQEVGSRPQNLWPQRICYATKPFFFCQFVCLCCLCVSVCKGVLGSTEDLSVFKRMESIWLAGRLMNILTICDELSGDGELCRAKSPTVHRAAFQSEEWDFGLECRQKYGTLGSRRSTDSALVSSVIRNNADVKFPYPVP